MWPQSKSHHLDYHRSRQTPVHRTVTESQRLSVLRDSNIFELSGTGDETFTRSLQDRVDIARLQLNNKKWSYVADTLLSNIGSLQLFDRLRSVG
jgi:hypothetical protein